MSNDVTSEYNLNACSSQNEESRTEITLCFAIICKRLKHCGHFKIPYATNKNPLKAQSFPWAHSSQYMASDNMYRKPTHTKTNVT
jgi:hypothetical protein